jgi:uncharacterized membrane protein
VNLWALAATAFVAGAVEAIEAATIVLAVGYTNGWRVALSGAAYAGIALIAIIGIGGAALVAFVPLRILQVVIGVFLMWFGYRWLRKAILRFAGRIPLHDESAIYERHVAALRAKREDRLGLATSFNGVFLEGLEVAIIVVTVGSASRAALAVSAAGAVCAAIAVTSVAVLVRRPFARIPENAMKFGVGIMLVAFGTFWLGEGVGFAWWFGDATVLVLAAAYAAAAGAFSVLLRPTH